ncbi:MAG: sugar phosphate nucleotidyltransferase [Weeksellaceae bacterium]|nr:sugar phosphate nucleotidyltransferase [Weeksellaceae bacterium]
MPTDLKAMIFAAGLGTRLQPFTHTAPKALYPINGKPVLQRNIEYLKHYGITSIVINTHHFAEQINQFLEQNHNFGINIQLSYESELLETGGGLIQASKYLKDSTFVVLNADVLTNADLGAMIVAHHTSPRLATLAVDQRHSSRQLVFNAQHQLQGWVNHNTGESVGSVNNSTLRSFNGMHIIDPQFFSANQRIGKFSIIHSYLDLMQNHAIVAHDVSHSKFIDIGKPENTALASQLFP